MGMFCLQVPAPHFRLAVINLDKEFGYDMELVQINTVCVDFAYVRGQSITGAVSPYQEVSFIYSLSNEIMTAGN